MNEKEISEIRRRFRADKSNITQVYGCYVNENREIISDFSQSMLMAPQSEAESYISILKRTLSGTLNKNLLDICFSTKQVTDSDEHRLLMALKDSKLQDREAVQELYKRIIETVSLEGNYLILLAADTYDVPYHSKSDEVFDDSNEVVFSYFVCCICPVKQVKPALGYSITTKEFHNREAGWVVSPPELGFMFPAFDDRASNIYNALYYTRDTAEIHSEFIDRIFKVEVPMAAQTQKETFQSILENSLEDECSYDVMHAVHDQLTARVELHKANKEIDPLSVSKEDVKDVLMSYGISDEKVDEFDRRYDNEFGAGTNLSPKNIIDTNQFELRTPDIVIKVNPERGDLIETRIIDGRKYILIDAGEGVEVNGVNIHI